MSNFRYNDRFQRFDEEFLSEAKTAQPVSAPATGSGLEGGLERCIEGDTAFRSIEDIKAAAAVEAEALLESRNAELEKSAAEDQPTSRIERYLDLTKEL